MTQTKLYQISHIDSIGISKVYISLGTIIINGVPDKTPDSYLEEIIRQKQPGATHYKIFKEKPVIYDDLTDKISEVKAPYFCVETYKQRSTF